MWSLQPVPLSEFCKELTAPSLREVKHSRKQLLVPPIVVSFAAVCAEQ